jgi:hypothetical protein
VAVAEAEAETAGSGRFHYGDPVNELPQAQRGLLAWLNYS